MKWKEVKEKYPNVANKSILAWRFADDRDLDKEIFPLSADDRKDLLIEFFNHLVIVSVVKDLYKKDRYFSYWIQSWDDSKPNDIAINYPGSRYDTFEQAEEGAWAEAFAVLNHKMGDLVG